MLNDYKNAFAYFTKAIRLYKKIGDKVSYAYTLWGLSTTYKMVGKLKNAHDLLMKAMALFKTTKDPRGIIYCKLGLGEISLLTGKKAFAKRHLSTAQNESDKHGFAVEGCYAKTLMSLHNDKEISNTCYHQLGLRLKFQAMPLNFP